MAKKSDFLFSKESSRFFLPWICALMVFIASLVGRYNCSQFVEIMGKKRRRVIDCSNPDL